MNGKILDFNAQTGVGMLRADDGARLEFNVTEFKSQGVPTIGMVIDFDIKDGAAVGIYARSSGGDGAGTAAVADKAKNVFANFGQQIMHGDPNATVALTPAQLEEVSQKKAAAHAKGTPQKKKALPAKKRRPKKVERSKPLYKCTDCGGEVSGRADFCPHCGGPVARCVACGTPLDLSVDQCSACGREAETAVVSGGIATSCPRCSATAYAPKQRYWILFLFPPLWGFLFVVWILLLAFPKPEFLKPTYACSRCDHTFYQ